MRAKTPGKGQIDLPRLLSQFDKEQLGNFPTPLRYIHLNKQKGFWMKDEGSSHCSYGGNKVRKLEYLFALARQNNQHRLVVWGDTTSHTVEAVSVLGRQSGFDVSAVMYRDPNTADSNRYKPSPSESHASVYITSNMLSAFLLARLKGIQPTSSYVPLGATTAYSTLGHVSAACEFVEQWRSSGTNWPKSIYVAMGSGGTVAGLATGFALLDAPIKLNAVQTVNSSVTNVHTLRKQIAAVLKVLALDVKHAKSILSSLIHIDHRYLGKGYGDITGASLYAVKKASAFGVDLEPVHTGKVMAAILHDISMEDGPDILYWNTHNQVGCIP